MIFLGLILIVLGTLMLTYSRHVYNFTGGIDFIEEHFRAGTPAAIKLFALAMVIIGIFLATGLGHSLTDPITHGLHQIFPSNNN